MLHITCIYIKSCCLRFGAKLLDQYQESSSQEKWKLSMRELDRRNDVMGKGTVLINKAVCWNTIVEVLNVTWLLHVFLKKSPAFRAVRWLCLVIHFVKLDKLSLLYSVLVAVSVEVNWYITLNWSLLYIFTEKNYFS